MKNVRYTTIDEYISTFPGDIQSFLKTITRTIRKAAPEASESISYGMPAFKLHGKILVYFAAWKHHIGFYATPSGNTAFKKELAQYKGGKGSVQFPLDQPLPLSLITKIVQFKVNELTKTGAAS